MVNDLVMNYISYDDSLLFDGYPRTLEQGKFLDDQIDIDCVFFLDVKDSELEKRILERGKTSNREDDKNINTIRHRIQTYKDETYPLVNYYSNQNKLEKIDGNKTLDEISDIIKNKLIQLVYLKQINRL